MEIGVLSSWTELYALPGFQRSVGAATMKQGKAIKTYNMPRKDGLEKCGIAECGTPHLNGFIVELVTGELSNVGKDCGKKHFGKDEWRVQMRTLRRREELKSAAAALEDAKRVAILTIAKIDLEPIGIGDALALLSAFDSLPPEIRAELRKRAHHSDSRIMKVRDPTAGEIANAKFHANPRPHSITVQVGKIDGLAAISDNSRADVVLDRLKRQAHELRDLAASAGVRAEQILGKVKTVHSTQKLLLSAIERLGLFFSANNLAELEKLHGGKGVRDNLLVPSQRHGAKGVRDNLLVPSQRGPNPITRSGSLNLPKPKPGSECT